MPPNTTSKSQPMDQGVIRSMKANYRRRMLRKYIDSLDAGRGKPQIKILEAMVMLVSYRGMKFRRKPSLTVIRNVACL